MKRLLVSMLVVVGLAVATGCATSGKRSAARPSGSSPYLTEQDGMSWWDTRSMSSTKKNTYRR